MIIPDQSSPCLGQRFGDVEQDVVRERSTIATDKLGSSLRIIKVAKRFWEKVNTCNVTATVSGR